MTKRIVASVLHGAYGDIYEQALCLKHYAVNNPEVELKLFAATKTRLESFRTLDLSFASGFELWTEIERHPEIERFYQFQVFDGELKADVLSNLSPAMLAKFDREHNVLPWNYLRDHKLIPPAEHYRLVLSDSGRTDLVTISAANGVADSIWQKPTIGFLWRYRRPDQKAVSGFGQKPQEKLVTTYSKMFRELIERCDCHILICGMNVVTDNTNIERTDNKYPPFGLDLPADRATYLKGLSWPLELEIASRATACCGHASGFSEGMWLKRGGNVVLMDAPPHYLAKAAYYRVPLFDLDRPAEMVRAIFSRSADAYGQRIETMLKTRR
jgi:hypothetical protein